MSCLRRRTRVSWTLASVATGVLVLGAWATPAAFAANTIFWTTPYEANQIYYGHLDGSSSTASTVKTTGATVDAPWGVAPDPATGKIYWANFTAGGGGTKISWANLDGSGAGDLPTGKATVDGPAGLVVDHAAGKIYWANWQAGKISWADLDGSGGGDLNTGTATVSGPYGVAIDPVAGKIYWANFIGNAISFAKLDNSGGGDLNIRGTTVDGPWGVTIDGATGKIYWGNFYTDTLDSADLDGTGGGALSTSGADQSRPMPGAIDPATGKIYWANNMGYTIAVANADGSGRGRTLYPTPTGARPAMPALLEVPAGTGAPVISGGAGVPTTLSCSRGNWGEDLVGSALYRAPQSVSYRWLKNGSPIPGATGSSIALGSSGSYQCDVTAQNFAGSSVQTSAPDAVAPPATASITGSTSGRTALVQVTCHGVSGQTCAGPVSLTANAKQVRRAIAGISAAKLKRGPVTVGSGSYSVAAGRTVNVRILLNKAGKKLLRTVVALRTTLALPRTTARPLALTFRLAPIRVDWRSVRWAATLGDYVTAYSLVLAPVPVGASVHVSCHGRGCPFAERSLKAKKRSLKLTGLFGRHRHLLPVTKVKIEISAADHVGELLTFSLAGRSVRKPTIRCLPPGSRRPVRC
jgi:DNA-binding beta-propeller fold protein YncE